VTGSAPVSRRRQNGGVSVSGQIAPGYESLGEALALNQQATDADAGDLGAALTVIIGGRTVVDIWTGSIDHQGTPWQRDTLVNIYSVGKPVAAVLALDAVQRGELQLDEPLAHWWPDMAEHHPATTLRHALTHQAALPAIAQPLPDDAILDWDVMCAALAATPPWWQPGRAHGYHVNTYGFLAGEPVSRTSGMTFADALTTRLTGPRELDLHIGMRPEDCGRASVIDAPGADGASGGIAWPTGTASEQMIRQSYFNPPTMSGMGIVNTDRWRRASVPSTNGHATARAVAGFYAALLPSAPDPLLSPDLLHEATAEQVAGPDKVIVGRPTRFGLGFQLHQDERPIGTSPSAYGHFGYGGSLGFADPAHDLSFAYLINRPGDRWQNPRTLRLLEELRRLLG